jgi:hypothetical protein
MNDVRIFVLLLGLVAATTGCYATYVTPALGPLYADPNGNLHIGVALAGPEAGAPCLQSPVCLVPAQ